MTFDPRIVKARSALIMQQPFFGTLALYLVLVEDEGIETMATDGTNLIYAPSFLDTCTAKELQGVVAHEVMHCAYQHHTRRGNRDPGLWNQAADYAINRDLIAGGFSLPAGALLDPKYDGLGAEEIYTRLQNDRSAQKPSPQPGEASQASQGEGGSPRPAQGGKSALPPSKAGSGEGQAPSWGKVLDAAPSHEPAKLAEAKAEWETRVRQAIGVAKSANAGAVPGGLAELAKAINKPQVNWRDELRRFIDSRSRSDYAWTQPNKRYLSDGIIFPGVVNDGLQKLGIVVDTSGSIDITLLRQFASEVGAAINEGAAEEVIIIQCDTRVTKVERFNRGDDIQINAHGRGGTKFGPALKWFQDNEPDVAALIYFTDLDSSDFGEEPECPLLWAACGYQSELDRLVAKVPFGEVIKVVS